MDFKLVYRVSYRLFSVDKNNMRFFNLKRLLISLFLLPFFILAFLCNRIFLALDHILFPGFKKQKVVKPVFIIAAPRSATTFLFHQMAGHRDTTTFKLWEIAFAPSITQKYLWLFLIRIDKKAGAPLRSVLEMLEGFFVKKFRHIHLIGLKYPEEDEGILLWNFSTLYLHFFYPDNNLFDDYMRFDEVMTEKKKKSVMTFYFRCVQRHNYVFNHYGGKTFVSKNPAMMCKIKSLYSFFPDAAIININRNPSKTIPSTIALNEAIFSFFSTRKSNQKLNLKIRDMLIDWYKMADRHLHEFYPNRHLRLHFSEVTGENEKAIIQISELCGLNPSGFAYVKENSVKKENHVSRNNYSALPTEESEELMKELPFMKEYCI